MIIFYLSPLYDALVKQEEKPNLEQFLDFRRASDVNFSGLNGRIDNLEYLIEKHYSLAFEIQGKVFEAEHTLVEINIKIDQIKEVTDLHPMTALSLEEIKFQIDAVSAQIDEVRQLGGGGLDEIAY